MAINWRFAEDRTKKARGIDIKNFIAEVQVMSAALPCNILWSIPLGRRMTSDPTNTPAFCCLSVLQLPAAH